jgi:KDO2-lipid IV(A) lauroyltransferase
VYLFSARDRANLGHNLRLVFNGAKPPESIRMLVWKLFRNYAFYIVDYFRLFSMTAAESAGHIDLSEGRSHLDAALAQGKGVLLLTPHLGHWEVGGLGIRCLGYPLNVVGIKHNTSFTNNLLNILRARHDIRVIELGDSIFDSIEIVNALNRNELVAMLADRPFFERTEKVPFFGGFLEIPVGPMLLAMATGAAVVPAITVMEAPGRYRGLMLPPLEVRKGPNRARALTQNIEAMVGVFEAFIRCHPDQWYLPERIPAGGGKPGGEISRDAIRRAP